MRNQLVKNQQNSIASIDQEIQLRVEKVKEQPADVSQCVFRTIVTDRFGIVTAEFGNVTGHFGDVTD